MKDDKKSSALLAASMAKSDALFLLLVDTAEEATKRSERLNAAVKMISELDAEVGLARTTQSSTDSAKKRLANMLRTARPDFEGLTDDEIVNTIKGASRQ